MNGIWRAAVAALLGHALAAPGVDAPARMVAALALVGLFALQRRRGFVVLVVIAGALGGLRLQARVDAALDWEGTRTRARFEVVELRRHSVRARLAAPDRTAVGAWISGVEGARPGQVWDAEIDVHPLLARRNPDDRDGVRNALGSGALLRARAVGAPLLVREGTASWSRRVRDRAHARWTERWGAGAGLWSALLLADRRGLDDDARSRLQSQGLAHLLALSGLHVGVLAGVLIWPWRKSGPRVWVASLPLLVAWTLVAGGGASMTRAVGMVGWIAVGRVRGRGTRPLDALAALVLLETVLRPEVICGVGWWLSYAATASILRILPWLSGRAWWQSALLVSLAAQSATAVWTLDAFGRIPWAAPVIQVVVGPAFTLLLAVGGLGAVLALGSGALAGAAAGLVALLAHGFGILVWVFSASGRLAVHHPGWEGFGWALAMALTALALVPLRWNRKVLRSTASLAVLVVAALHLPLFAGPRHRWISFDIGQGDAGVYHCGSRVLVIDAGPHSNGMLPAERVVIPYLARRHVRGATLVLTHGHLDHTAGTRALLASGHITTLALAATDSTQAWAHELRTVALQRRVDLRWLSTGDTLWSDCCDAICLWPDLTTSHQHANDRSVVLRLGPRGAPLMTCGDLERKAEFELLDRLRGVPESPRPRWSLKVAHHGGNTGTDAPWLRWLTPRHALISCGHGNRYGHPHPDLLGRLHECGAEVVRTDREGAAELRWKATGEPPGLVRHGRRPTRSVLVDALRGRIYAAAPAGVLGVVAPAGTRNPHARGAFLSLVRTNRRRWWRGSIPIARQLQGARARARLRGQGARDLRPR